MMSSPSHEPIEGPLPRVAVLVLNYKNASDTMACLDALASQDYADTEVWVVDNDSQDGSAEAIAQAYPHCHLIQAPDNLGFSGGNNLGFQAILDSGRFEYVWLLNNDTMVRRDCLTELVWMAKTYPNSIIGPVILNPDGSFQRVGTYMTHWTGAVRHYGDAFVRPAGEGRCVEALSGCAMLIPVEVLKTVGLWTEAYFLYFEDTDYCLRAARAGVTCRIAPRARLLHKEGATTGRAKPLVTYYYQRNRLMVFYERSAGLAGVFERAFCWLYTHWRLVRSRIKSWRSGQADLQLHHRAFELAVKDFYRGVTGKCPHQDLCPNPNP